MFLSYQPMVRYNNWAYTKNQSAEFAFSISSKSAHTGGIGRVELLGTGQGQRHGKIEITPGDKFTAKGNICVGKGFIFFFSAREKQRRALNQPF